MKSASSVLILGFGVSGRSAAKLAASLKMKISLADERDDGKLRASAAALLPQGSELTLGWRPGKPLPKAELVVASPGLSGASPLLQEALKLGVPAVSELEFGFRSLPCPAVAITGTNGKTTTTELCNVLLNAAGLKSEAAGNIGNGLCEAALAAKEQGLKRMVVEVSSFQLERCSTFAPEAAAILNIASDHINRHGGLEGYAKVKFSIFDRMPRDSRKTIVNANLLDWWRKLMPSGEPPTTFSSEGSADFALRKGVIEFRGKPVFDMAQAQLKGVHNAENAMAALALVRAVLGDEALRDKRVLDALAAFRAGDHRIELFAEWNGIKFIDDSKGTNPHAVVAAVKALEGPGKISLVLGGLDKGMDFSPLLDFAPRVRKAAIIGQCREKIAACLGDSMDFELCDGPFQDAVGIACRAALPGDFVMLSPACASMDMFKDYKERGDSFKRLVKEWIARKRREERDKNK